MTIRERIALPSPDPVDYDTLDFFAALGAVRRLAGIRGVRVNQWVPPGGVYLVGDELHIHPSAIAAELRGKT